jgi:DNA-directed RNA polymerase specialized sigma24 family protein
MSLAFARYIQILDTLLQRPEPREEARQLREQGVSIREISKILGVSRETVRRYFPQAPEARQKHDDATKARYWELRAAGFSIRGAAREMGLNKGTVQWWEDEAKRA